MTVNEIFAKIINQQVQGIMLHDEMANSYDFLGFAGFKRMHEYQFISEAAKMRSMSRYFVSRYNMLVRPEKTVERAWAIPDSWYKYARTDVNASTKYSAVKTSMTTWCDWEQKTKKLYEQLYRQLLDMDEAAAACKVGELVKCVDDELCFAQKLMIKLQSVDYDMSYMYSLQDELHCSFKKKMKHMNLV